MSGYRTTKSHDMHLQWAPEQLFPLLCPVLEYKWIEGWKCQMIHSISGVAELDCVFKTNFPTDGPEDTWVVTRYEPPLMVEFIRINSMRSVRFIITLSRKQDGSTHLTWTQIFTGLNSEGDDLVRSVSDEAFQERVGLRERQINNFLSTGQMLSVT